MKRLLTGALLALLSLGALGATTVPVQLLNPTGSTSGQTVVSNGPSSAPTWGSVPLGGLSSIAANTVLANATASSAAPAAFAMPSCSTSASALTWTTSTGFTCNTAVNAATLGGATFAAPGAIGGTTPGSGAFTTLSASSTVSGTGFSAYLASPPAIGGTAAAAGSFTTLSASSTVSGTGFSTYLASPPAIGGTAAAAGSFTTLSASSTVSGSGFSTYLASPPAIGTTAAAAGKFTTLQATGAITPSATAGIVGTTGGDNAQAGSYGEFVSASSSGTAITSGTTVNATSISLTAGDYNCWGQALFLPAATTVVANVAAGITTTSVTLPASPDTTYLGVTLTTGTNGTTAINPMVKRINISSTTTVYLVAEAGSVTTSTATVNGYLQCRRVR